MDALSVRVDTGNEETGLPSIADPAGVRVLLALAGGRVLPASMLAAEAGLSASSLRLRLRELLAAGLVTATPYGRHRYYRLAGPHGAALVETAARRGLTIGSLRPGTKAHALRRARRCYGHLAGRLGCALTSAFIDRGHLTGHDGSVDLDRLAGAGTLAGTIDPVAYTLTDSGVTVLGELGGRPPADRTVHCCVDWTEQCHHIAGAVGRHLLHRFEQHGWIRHGDHHRAMTVTAAGRDAFAARFGVDVSTLS
jgi:DNA-binding transcriptional ArsR family regulator